MCSRYLLPRASYSSADEAKPAPFRRQLETQRSFFCRRRRVEHERASPRSARGPARYWSRLLYLMGAAAPDVVFQVEDAELVPPVGPDRVEGPIIGAQVNVVPEEEEVAARGRIGDPVVRAPAFARRLRRVEDVVQEIVDINSERTLRRRPRRGRQPVVQPGRMQPGGLACLLCLCIQGEEPLSTDGTVIVHRDRRR